LMSSSPSIGSRRSAPRTRSRTRREQQCRLGR
jgi:hypothetical protein